MYIKLMSSTHLWKKFRYSSGFFIFLKDMDVKHTFESKMTENTD